MKNYLFNWDDFTVANIQPHIHNCKMAPDHMKEEMM